MYLRPWLHDIDVFSYGEKPWQKVLKKRKFAYVLLSICKFSLFISVEWIENVEINDLNFTLQNENVCGCFIWNDKLPTGDHSEVNSTGECNSSIDKIMKTSVNVEKELKALKPELAGVNTKLQHVRSKVGHVLFVFFIFGCFVFGAYNGFWK